MKRSTKKTRNTKPVEARASLENPSTPLSDPDAWEAFTGGYMSDTGLTVTPEKALTSAPVFRAVNLIARDVGKLPLVVYQRDGIGKGKASTHPAYKLLRYKANPSLNALAFRQSLTAQAVLKGNAYAYIERLGDGTPVALYPINPDNC